MDNFNRENVVIIKDNDSRSKPIVELEDVSEYKTTVDGYCEFTARHYRGHYNDALAFLVEFSFQTEVNNKFYATGEDNSKTKEYSFLYIPNSEDREKALQKKFFKVKIIGKKRIKYRHNFIIDTSDSKEYTLCSGDNNSPSSHINLKIPVLYRDKISYSLVGLYGSIMDYVGVPHVDNSYKAYSMAVANYEICEKFDKFVAETLVSKSEKYLSDKTKEYNENITIKELCDEKIKEDFNELEKFMKL